MQKQLVGLFIISACSSSAFAQEAQYKIKQIISNKNLIVAESSTAEPAEVGKIFLATFPDNTQCPLKVMGQMKNLITLDSADCDRAKNLTLNQTLEPSLHFISEPVKVATPAVTKPSPAATPAPTNTSQYARSVADLSYLAPRHTFALNLGFSTDTTEYSVYNGTTLGTNVKIRTTRLPAELKFGLTDDLNLNISLALIPGKNVEYSSTSATYYSKGFEDPELSMNYRLIEQSMQTPMDVVFTIGFAPKTFEAKSATDKADGTVGSGRNTLSASLEASKKFSSIDIGMRLAYVSLWSGKSQDAETAEETELGTYDALALQAGTQIKFSEAFYLAMLASVRSYSSYEQKSVNTNTMARQSAYTETRFYVGPRFVVIPQRAVLNFGVESTAATNIDLTSGTTKLKVKDYTGSQLSASVKYEF